MKPDSPQAAIAAGIGFAPEDRKHEALLLFRSILDNAALCVPDKTSTFGLFNRRKAMDIVAPLAAKMAIKAPDLDEQVSKLSGGNQQKVVLARWLARQPMLLILDEPTRGIDIGAKAEIYRLIDELAASGIGLILISSEMPELIGLADRVLVMAGGRITAELDASGHQRGGDPEARHAAIGGSARRTASSEQRRPDSGRKRSRRARPDVADRRSRRRPQHQPAGRARRAHPDLRHAARRRVLFHAQPAQYRSRHHHPRRAGDEPDRGHRRRRARHRGRRDRRPHHGVDRHGDRRRPARRPLGIAAGLVVGGLAGLVNGLIITYGRVNAVIATLGTMAIFRGIAFIMSDGQSIAIFSDTFRFIGIGRILGLPLLIWILIATAIAFQVFLARSIVGRNIYALGGNPVVARFSGINVNRYRVGIYIMSGVAAGLAGILLAARTGSGQPVSGSQGLELEAITAAVLGGCALQGGKGTIVGALLGVAIIGILNNGMILTSVPTFYQLLAKGSLLILAVVIAEYHLNRN